MIPFSSGTTGSPKGVELTHRNLVASGKSLITPPFNVQTPCTGTDDFCHSLYRQLFRHFSNGRLGLTAILSHVRFQHRLDEWTSRGRKGIEVMRSHCVP